MSVTRTPTAATPLMALENKNSRTLEQLERTPVVNQDKGPKIQLCIELRKKEMKKTKRSSKAQYELVLEVSVMYLKNLPVKQFGGNSKISTFVKICLTPGQIIHSTELKMDKQNKEKVDLDFIEVFGFPLENEANLEGRKMEVLVCDKKMTRNAFIFGQAEINVEDIRLGKPVCKWFNLTSGTESNAKDEN